MSCCDPCQKPGFGVFAGNNPCGADMAAKKIQSAGGVNMGIVNGVHYASTKINVENMIPILGIASGAQQSLVADKIARAQAGETFDAPDTFFGRLFGRITGRTQASEISKAMQTAQSQAPLDPATAKNLSRQGIPISGSLSYGQEQSQTLKILGILGAVIVAIFYFNKPKGRKRR